MAIIRELGYSTILFENIASVWDAITHLVDCPELFSEFLMIIIDTIPIRFSMQQHHFILDTIELYMSTNHFTFSPKETTALLRAFSVAFEPSNKIYMSKKIDRTISLSIDNACYYCSSENLEDLPEFLRVCLQMGGFQEVQKFFVTLPTCLINQMLYRHSNVVNELFHIAQTVRMDRAFVKYIVSKLNKSPEGTVQYPGVFMKTMLSFMHNKKKPAYGNIDTWISRFLRVYREMFRFNMEDAVYLLYLICEQGVPIQEWGVAYMHSLMYYRSLLDKSVREATRLLIMFEKMENTDKQKINLEIWTSFDMAFSIECCFNKAMSIQDKKSIPQLMELLNNLSLEEKKKLAKYFTNQDPYLWAYSTRLAKRVKELYQ